MGVRFTFASVRYILMVTLQALSFVDDWLVELGWMGRFILSFEV